MPLPIAYFWSKAPFVRLLIALIAGIVLQWHLQPSTSFWITLLTTNILFIIIYFLLPVKTKFQLRTINGININLLMASVGGILIWIQDIRHDKLWIGRNNTDSSYLFVTIEEPLVEKTNSFKALSSVTGLYSKSEFKNYKGNIIVYFKKDSSLNKLHYGSQIVFKKPLQEIKNSGNPGSFDYKQYSLFQGITHQVNLSGKEFEILSTQNTSTFKQFIFNCRNWIVTTLRKFIPGEKEQGLAEALLIGYKNDLDTQLVQSYTNTGVVHIIAISGMHLALIYGLLLILTKPLRRKNFKWLQAVLILSALWIFTLLAGAQASVVRSAVMFTCIALTEVLSRKTSIYNTLGLSAFILLIYNPFWLWDVGFQLSYAAVASIVTFYQPVYNWIYFPNKLLDFLWKTIAISIAAQILTTPVSLHHFHQFPVLFLLTNIVAVPLSSLILFGEIFLCSISWLTPIAKFSGHLIEWMIYCMNSYIEMIEKISFSLWNGFSVSILQTILLLIAATAFCIYLTEKKTWMLWLSLIPSLVFVCLRSISFVDANSQRRLIVYNVPKYSAIDLIDGRRYNFIGDSVILYDDFLRNFHLQPSRIFHRIVQNKNLPICCKGFQFGNKQIAIIDSAEYFIPLETRQKIDILILSRNPKLFVSGLLRTFSINQIVIDGSVPVWKAKLWKKECDSLNIHCFDVTEKGAFVMNL